jgi:hypothetical protein
MTSLAEFAAQEELHSRPGGCKVCADPRVREINEGRAHGMSIATIARWTMAGGAAIGNSTLGDHFRNGHDTRG